VLEVGGHYLSNTLTDDSVGHSGELLLQLVEQLHDGNVAAAQVTACHLLCQAWSSPPSSSCKQEFTHFGNIKLVFLTHTRNKYDAPKHLHA
jgi:hypothetical protein